MKELTMDEEVYQKIEIALERLQRANQHLIKYGKEGNRDVIAREFAVYIFEIGEAMKEIKISESEEEAEE